VDVGPSELIIVLVIALVMFGGAKLPELARSIGLAKKEFEKGARGETAADEAKRVDAT
jgi:sec-independent protein translocase protein TatA